MFKYILLFTGFLVGFFPDSYSQLCPGGGSTYSAVVPFSYSWIQGCLTGTSCNGGTEFNNRAACESTSSMDACAPPPTCTSETNGSDVWFSFIAEIADPQINVIQNVSFIVGIQAFSGDPACGSLVQIGCVVSSGPSTGATLALNGLTTGQTYYFRVFGSSTQSSQRTGTYCFCGSVGIVNSLPVELSDFRSEVLEEIILLKWMTYSENQNDFFTVERSTDGITFTSLGIMNGAGNSLYPRHYSYTDYRPLYGLSYYRLQQTDFDDNHSYSEIAEVFNAPHGIMKVYPNPTASGQSLMLRWFDMETEEETIIITIADITGRQIYSESILAGRESAQAKLELAGGLAAGTYVVTGRSRKTLFRQLLLISR